MKDALSADLRVKSPGKSSTASEAPQERKHLMLGTQRKERDPPGLGKLILENALKTFLQACDL